MLRLCFTLSFFIGLLISCNKSSSVITNPDTCPDITYFDLDCIIEFNEPAIIGSNGFHTFLYDNGLIKSEGNLSHGVPNGFWKFYYDNGHLKTEGNYSNGQLNGFWKVYWYNGNIREEGHYQYCEKQGFWKFFYPTINHQLHYEGSYNQGKRINEWKAYDKDNKLTFDGLCND